MKNKRKYFGTDGIRGKANSNNMNASLALNIGMATAEYFTRGNHKHFVLIGKDTRLSNYTIEPSLTAILRLSMSFCDLSGGKTLNLVSKFLT